ncbi:MAG TPA: MOSC domain-containing protein [Gemmatimonadales bacterium]|nr:MOSC domain-containing protein [Gemmatimonadales bacterium]
MRLVSVQVGTPRTVGIPNAEDRMERAFTSAIWKSPVAGPVHAGPLGLTGDAVAETDVHGGLDQAVLMYSAAHYPLWMAELGRDLRPGAFGENLTVEGLDEDTVCIGDVLEVERVRFEVSHPRSPCSTLARRHQIPDMIAIVRENGRSGWYLRVLIEGPVEAGQPIRLLDRPNSGWTIRRAAGAMLQRHRRPAEAAELARCRGLSEEWRVRLTKQRTVL